MPLRKQDLPDMSHLLRSEFDKIYEPAEDTYLLIDTLLDDASLGRLNSVYNVLEIGPGSGIVTKALSEKLEGCVFYMSEIGENAARVAKLTGNTFKLADEVIRGDLLSCWRSAPFFDLIFFNPPYVPTPSEEIAASEISTTWAGGVDGREVIDRLIPTIAERLSPGGAFYLLVVKENKPDDVVQNLLQAGFFSAEQISQRRAFNETQIIIRAIKST